MSTVVLQNDAMVFGSQSPYNRYITEPGAKEKFFAFIGNRNSKVLVKRGFRTFMLMNKIFPNNTVEINENVKYALGQLVQPFLNLAIANDISSVTKVNRTRYSQGEIALTSELQKATKVKNLVAMIIDSESEHIGCQQGITTFITKKMNTCGESEIQPKWENKFFTFENPNDISIVIAIPKKYIANILVCRYADFTNKGTLGSSIENIEYKGKVVDSLVVDLVKSIFTAIYTDSYRSRIIGDIYNLEVLFKNEGQNISSKGYTTESKLEMDIFKKYPNLIKKFKSKESENLILFMLEYIKFKSNASLNPLEFYKGFVDVPYNQIESVFAKSNAFKRFTDNTMGDFNFSNNLSCMDKFFVDESRDIIVYAVKLIRYLPFVIFNTYVMGNGSDHSKTVQIMSYVNRIIQYLNQFKNTSPIFQNISTWLADELRYINEVVFTDFSSPLNVTNNARFVITSTISIYGFNNDDEENDNGNISE